MAGLERIDIDEADQHFGDRLHDGAGNRRRGRRAGLAGRQQQDRNAALHAGFEHAAGVLGEFHRRHDEAVGVGDERPGAEILLAAGDRVEHLQRRRDVLAHREAGADMLGRAHHAGVERVEIHLERIGNVARHHRPLEEMDVVQPLDETRGVVNVLQQRFAIFALLDIDHMHGSTRRAVVDALALDQHVVLGVLAVQREMPRRVLDRGQHQPARKADAAVVAVVRADARQRFDAARNRIGEADRLQKRQHRFVDALEVVLAQRLVPAAFEAGTHRPDVVGQRRRPHGPPRFAPAGAPRTLIRRLLPALQAPLDMRACSAFPASRPRLVGPPSACIVRLFGDYAAGWPAVCASRAVAYARLERSPCRPQLRSAGFRRRPAAVRPRSPVRGCPARYAAARSRKCRAA